jgi:hypothetical protein
MDMEDGFKFGIGFRASGYLGGFATGCLIVGVFFIYAILFPAPAPPPEERSDVRPPTAVPKPRGELDDIDNVPPFRPGQPRRAVVAADPGGVPIPP